MDIIFSAFNIKPVLRIIVLSIATWWWDDNHTIKLNISLLTFQNMGYLPFINPHMKNVIQDLSNFRELVLSEKMSDPAVEAAPEVAASEPTKPSKPAKAPPLDPRLKQIKIKTGVLKRVGKEKLSYRKEADMQKAKLDKMKEDGKDEHDVKKMGEVLQETLMMIPDCHRRIVAAKGELEQLLETETDLRTKEDGEECEEFLAAEAQVKEAEEQLKVE